MNAVELPRLPVVRSASSLAGDNVEEIANISEEVASGNWPVAATESQPAGLCQLVGQGGNDRVAAKWSSLTAAVGKQQQDANNNRYRQKSLVASLESIADSSLSHWDETTSATPATPPSATPTSPQIGGAHLPSRPWVGPICVQEHQSRAGVGLKLQEERFAGLGDCNAEKQRQATNGKMALSFQLGADCNQAGAAREPDHSSSERTAQRQRRGKLPPPFMFAGILGSILGSVFFSFSMLCIKLLPDGQGLAEKTKIVLFRGLFIMLLCATTIIYQKSTFLVKRDELWVNALRSMLGFVGVYGAYISLKYITIGDSTALVFSSPIWTSLLSHFILNEPLQWIQLVALPASLLGIVLIAHPALLMGADQLEASAAPQPPGLEANETTSPRNGSQHQHYQALNVDLDVNLASSDEWALDSEHRWIGVVVALLTSLVVSCVYIVLKFRKSTPIQTTTFWLGFATFAGALCIQLCIGFGAMPASLAEWALIFANGFFSWLGQGLLQWSLYFEDASVLSVIRTLDVAMTFALSALFLHEEILWTSILGAAIIASVVVSIMLNNWISSRLWPPKCPEAAQAGEQQQPQVAATLPMVRGDKGAKASSRSQSSAAA